MTLILEYCRGGDLFDAIVAQSKAPESSYTGDIISDMTIELFDAILG